MVNPFASRFIRPGAIPFFDSDDFTFDGVVEALRDNGGWGQIVGPHGCGKSTLLQHLTERFETDGTTVLSFAFRESNKPNGPARSLKTKLALIEKEPGGVNNIQVTLDGFEQLNWWHRLRMIRICSKAGVPLLVTTHRPLNRLPIIASIELTAAIAERVTRHLFDDAGFIEKLDFGSLLNRHNGNMREILFDLYDRYQQRAQQVTD